MPYNFRHRADNPAEGNNTGFFAHGSSHDLCNDSTVSIAADLKYAEQPSQILGATSITPRAPARNSNRILVFVVARRHGSKGFQTPKMMLSYG
jgi:hypothetical protein